MSHLKLARRALFTLLVLAAPTVFAANENATINVQATVTGVCRFTGSATAPQTLAMTAAPNVGGVVSATAPVTFKCTKDLAYTYSVTDGTSTDSDGSLSGTLTDGTNTIAFTATWTQPDGTGDGFSAANEVTSSILVSVAEAAYIDKPAGVYTRTLTVNINY